MTQEEKLKEAKRLYQTANADQRYVLESLFPELKESEDERMRNAAINACKYMVDNFENSTKQYEDAIAWLEKQGEQKPAWSEADERKLNDAIDACKTQYGNMSYTADWLLSLKDRVQPQKEWSEEDEEILENIIGELELVKKSVGEINYKGYDRLINWLKSLKPNHWKPSDEQMLAIQEAMDIVGILTITGCRLNSLYQDLKKLK